MVARVEDKDVFKILWGKVAEAAAFRECEKIINFIKEEYNFHAVVRTEQILG
jgi:hypothetical protein